MIKLTQLQNYTMTKAIRISNKLHREIKRAAMDKDITIQEEAEARLT